MSTPEEETDKLREAMRKAGFQHAPEFEGDDFIFPRGTAPTEEERKAALDRQLDKPISVSGPAFDFSSLVKTPAARVVADHRTEEQKIKEDYYHLLRHDNKTFCGIDTLTSLTADEGGQWREGCSPAEFSAKPCPACVKARQQEEDDVGEDTYGGSLPPREDAPGSGETLQ